MQFSWSGKAFEFNSTGSSYFQIALIIRNREVFQSYYPEYNGQSFLAYLMNEPAFTLLLPRFKSQRAKKAQRAFNKSFYQMKEALLRTKMNVDNLLFQQLRVESKTVRRDLTDTLKEFAEYSKEQGSKGSAYIYSNTTKSINKSIGIHSTDAPIVRDSLTTEKIQQLEALEESVANCIAKGMESGIDYKLIKETVKRTIDNDAVGSYHHSRATTLDQS